MNFRAGKGKRQPRIYQRTIQLFQWALNQNLDHHWLTHVPEVLQPLVVRQIDHNMSSGTEEKVNFGSFADETNQSCCSTVCSGSLRRNLESLQRVLYIVSNRISFQKLWRKAIYHQWNDLGSITGKAIMNSLIQIQQCMNQIRNRSYHETYNLPFPEIHILLRYIATQS